MTRKLPEPQAGSKTLSRDMDVVGLEYTRQVGPVGGATAQTLDGGQLVSERLKEGEGELCRIEWTICG
jgi:hypothetical protein